ncbi:hypothetical protein ACMFMG_011827 [Clarireedia jacksonii]
MASTIFSGDNNSGLQAGSIKGLVNAEFHHHAPPERLETPPNPSIVIPFSRDTDFVERGIILDQVYQKCAVLGSRTALVGLGGVGKGKWLLILDNVDDAGFLVQAQSISEHGQTNSMGNRNTQPLAAYLPQCPNGSILITTRSKSAALKLVEQRNIIAVEPMDGVDALALFENKLGRYDDGDDTAKLAEALEFMPLAIVQAATYILQRAPRYSVRNYLQDFQKSDRKKTSLLNYEGEQLRRDWEAKNSIIITWQISFDYIREIRPSATDLLSLMSFFVRQGIPEALLRRREEQRNSQQDENSTTIEMHTLVQLATRKWLEVHKQQERWKQQFIRNLDAELPTGDYENWEKCQVLFPHAQSAVAQQPEEQDSLRGWASILYKAAWYAEKMGKGTETEEMSGRAMKVRKKILGREHNDTLNSIAMVGLAYKLRGKWDAAEELQVQVMETHKKKLGADHPEMLISIGNLASTYRNQGRWEAAEELEIQVMETRKKKLGADHLDTLISIDNLALTYMNQGRWEAMMHLLLIYY